MRLALLGNDSRGRELLTALLADGRHELAGTCDTDGENSHPDVEELLADSKVEWVIVAGPMEKRFEQLRRVLQAERHAICLHPCGPKPDQAYEAAILRDDAKTRLIPLHPQAAHPAIDQLQQWSKDLGPPRILTWDIRSTKAEFDSECWAILRQLGGDVVEVSGYAEHEEYASGEPLAIHGRFASGLLFQVTFLPTSPTSQQTLHIRWDDQELHWDGDSVLRIRGGRPVDQRSFADWNCWRSAAESIERIAVSQDAEPPWDREVRVLEVHDCLRRSVEKRRAFSLDYQEISEDVGSKGTLTLIGCGMVWVMLGLAFLAIWVPWILWLFVPLILGFLALFAMQWLGKRR